MDGKTKTCFMHHVMCTRQPDRSNVQWLAAAASGMCSAVGLLATAVWLLSSYLCCVWDNDAFVVRECGACLLASRLNNARFWLTMTKAGARRLVSHSSMM